MEEIELKVFEINESLVKLVNRILLELRQYKNIEEYEYKLRHITQGDDVII